MRKEAMKILTILICSFTIIFIGVFVLFAQQNEIQPDIELQKLTDNIYKLRSIVSKISIANTNSRHNHKTTAISLQQEG